MRDIPDKEYVLWIAGITSPLKILNLESKEANCFSRIIKSILDPELLIGDPGFVVKKPGLTISVYGQTHVIKETNEESKTHLIFFLYSPNYVKSS